VAVSGRGHATTAALSAAANDCSSMQRVQGCSMHHHGGQVPAAVAPWSTSCSSPTRSCQQVPEPIMWRGLLRLSGRQYHRTASVRRWGAGQLGLLPRRDLLRLRKDTLCRRFLFRHRGSGLLLNLCLRHPCMVGAMIRPS
jgi:hypothetical protein